MNITVDQAMAISRGELIVGSNGNLISANKGTRQGDGLMMHEKRDITDRKFLEFTLQEGYTKKTSWMAPFIKPGYLQIKINH